MERETGIEPATNSLEGCDSTTELLPRMSRSYPAFLSLLAHFADVHLSSCTSAREKVGGEGRVRTSVGTRPADLQSAAIDRSATSPIFTRPRGADSLATDASSRRVRPRRLFESITVYCDAFLGDAGDSVVELAEGFEPPTG